MSLPKGLFGVTGSIIYPSGLGSHVLARRRLSSHGHLRERYLDPQLYLSGLNAITCRKTCSKLATYPWFGTQNIPEYDSSEKTQNDYVKQIKATIHRNWKASLPDTQAEIRDIATSCISLQSNLNCRGIIAPVPLVVDQGDDYALSIRWLDAAIDTAESLGLNRPLFASVALSDSALRNFDPWDNQLLDVIIDQITARQFDGAYIVVEQTNESGYYLTHPNTMGSLLRLVWGLKRGGLKTVIVSQVGTAGLVCLGAGADCWSSGWYRSERRVRLADMEDQEGRTTPTFYSHKLASEIHLEADLDNLVKKGCLSDIMDETPASSGLLKALREGKKSGNVPEWRYEITNTGAAKEHFAHAVVRETSRLSNMTQGEVTQSIHDWLQTAEQMAADIQPILSLNPRTALNHQAAWLAAFIEFRRRAGI